MEGIPQGFAGAFLPPKKIVNGINCVEMFPNDPRERYTASVYRAGSVPTVSPCIIIIIYYIYI